MVGAHSQKARVRRRVAAYVMDPVVSINLAFLLGREESGEGRSMEMYAGNLEYIRVCIWLWA